MINKISAINKGCNCIPKTFDEEHIRIMKRLQAYGITPTGNKSTDKMLLHKKELEEAKKEGCVTTKFLTISKNEQEKIQEKKKENNTQNNPAKDLSIDSAQKLLGEQIYTVIQLKKQDS